MDGFYDDGMTPICLMCHLSCQTCELSAEQCTSCDITSNRILSGSSCVCSVGFFDAGVPLCEACPISCEDCENPVSCSSCSSANFRY